MANAFSRDLEHCVVALDARTASKVGRPIAAAIFRQHSTGPDRRQGWSLTEDVRDGSAATSPVTSRTAGALAHEMFPVGPAREERGERDSRSADDRRVGTVTYDPELDMVFYGSSGAGRPRGPAGNARGNARRHQHAFTGSAQDRRDRMEASVPAARQWDRKALRNDVSHRRQSRRERRLLAVNPNARRGPRTTLTACRARPACLELDAANGSPVAKTTVEQTGRQDDGKGGSR